MKELIVKDYGSNICILMKEDYWFNVHHDNCIDFPYDVNLENIFEQISAYEGKKLTAEERQIIEDKVGTWLSYHSCEDDEYYDGEIYKECN